MNRWPSFFVYILGISALLAVLTPAAAAPPTPPLADRGEVVDPVRDELSPAQERDMWAEIQRNVARLRSTGALAAPNATQTVTYNFPLRMAPGLPDDAGFRVSAFADHNSAAGSVLDYNGGTRTYDGHRGTDYALWPFSWNKVDAGEAQVIAAAAGTIAYKSDTDPTDHNPCDGGSSADNWNYIGIVHADGRLTLYGHMRHNSLTSKGIGQTVAQGEYLGIAASSGNSSGPHLHFEARYGSFSNNEWIDPYAGPSSQPGSLWTSQRPYYDSAINRLATHSAPPSTPDSCSLTTTNLQDSFTTPLNIYFYAYYRDYQGTLPTDLKIYRPDGSVFPSWSYTENNYFSGAYRAWAFAFTDSDPAGTWRFQATYNSQVYETFFNVNAPTTITVTSPNGGEQWNRDVAHSVTWTDNLGGDVNIALYHNGVYSATIVSNTPSDGEYLWTPDSTLAFGTGYTVRVTSVISPILYDVSNATFTLTQTHLVASDDFAMTLINTPVTLAVLSNDTSPYGVSMTITAVGVPKSGTASIVASNLVYTPTLGFLGTDNFAYTANTSTESANATVTVRVVEEIFRSFLPLIRR